LQCPFCEGLQGKTFEVNNSVNRIDNVMDGGDQALLEEMPFITSALDTKGLSRDQIVNKVTNMSSSELQSAGVEIPPYHPHCRDIVVAVL
jgi:hypothetical protein